LLVGGVNRPVGELERFEHAIRRQKEREELLAQAETRVQELTQDPETEPEEKPKFPGTP